jgi:hypothetical protein
MHHVTVCEGVDVRGVNGWFYLTMSHHVLSWWVRVHFQGDGLLGFIEISSLDPSVVPFMCASIVDLMQPSAGSGRVAYLRERSTGSSGWRTWREQSS